MIRQAEQVKARILEVPGKQDFNQFNQFQENFLAKLTGELMHSVIVDEEFSMVAAHIGEALKKKIEEGEYVDFVKLLP